MKKSVSCGMIACAFLLLMMLMVLPVSGIAVSDSSPASSSSETTSTGTTSPGTTPLASDAHNPFVSATISSSTPIVGDTVTISGVATGADLTEGIQIWVFAGDYVGVSTVPVSTDGSFSKTYSTAGLPPVTYYCFIQSPGIDGTFNLDLANTGTYSGQVVNTKTGALVLNFTGTGSVQDAAASKALSDALNQPGMDDVYTKLTFNLVAPGTPAAQTTVIQTTAVTANVPAAPAATATAKSPLSPFTLLFGAGIAGIACARFSRR